MTAVFFPIPGWPGYFVNREGIARSAYGELSRDKKGRYALKDKSTGKKRLFYPGELREMASASRAKESAVPAPRIGPNSRKLFAARGAGLKRLAARLAEARVKLGEAKGAVLALERKLKSNRSLNAALWSRLRRLERELQALPSKKRKERVDRELVEWSLQDKSCLEETEWLPD